MRATQYLLATLKKTPKNCEIISHQLMLRSGMVNQISSGIYVWLPTGLRVLRKIENIIREEMNKIGFLETLMPIIQPSMLWKKSGRWAEYGIELLRFKNRNNKEFILSPTHEEIITEVIYKITTSHKNFPINVYQIHTKYRDEARPRFGMIRSREFIMKDGYSFHTNKKSLQNTYINMYDIYHTIFNRIGLNFFTIKADPGKMGGILSHEFQAYSKIGENKIEIPINDQLNNLNLNYNNTSTIPTQIQPKPPQEIMRLIEVPKHNATTSIKELTNVLSLPIDKMIEIIIVQSNYQHKYNAYDFLGLVIRADHQLSYKKLLMIPEINTPLSIIHTKQAQKIIGIKPTLFKCIDLSIPLIIDYHVAVMNDFIAESNITGKYFFGINWDRDVSYSKIADLSQPKNNNHKNANKNILSFNKSIEIGHIFQIGEKYSNSIYSKIPNKNNKHNFTITMGCYGIGISRMIPVIIEQNYDSHGIIWPNEIAPFKLAIIPINMYSSNNVRNVAEKLYNQFLSIVGIDVFIDDRQERPGIILTDIDLIGIPHIFIISDRNLKNKEIEYKYRKTGVVKKIKIDKVIQFLTKELIKN